MLGSDSRSPSLKLLLAICLVAYLLTAGAHFGSTDEEDIYQNTALLSSRLASLVGMPSAADAPMPQEYRAPQEPGQSLAALPWYWAGQALSTVVAPRYKAYLTRAVMTTFGLCVTLVTIGVLYQWSSRLAGRRTAITVAALYGLASLAWPYSQTFYREPLVGLAILVGLWQAVEFTESRRRSHLLTSIAAMMLAVSVKAVSAVALPWWLICWVPTETHNRRRLWVGLGATCLVIAAMIALSLSAKHETLAHYVQELDADLHNQALDFFNYGLVGLLLSPGKGLLVCAPPVLLSVIGFPAFLRRNRREGVAIAGLFLTFLLVYSTRRGWHGGACWGPRYLLPIVPAMMLPATQMVDQCRETGGPDRRRLFARAAVTAMAIIGILVQLSSVSIFPLNFYLTKSREGVLAPESRDGGSAYLEEIFFEPAHSPIWGQIALAAKRTGHMIRHGGSEQLGILPAEADALWEYMISLETLDFWWLHLLMQSPADVAPTERLGVVLAPPDAEWLAWGMNAGALFNRWQVSWRDIEPTPGHFDFEESDRHLAAIMASGMKIAAILTNPPEWAVIPGTNVPDGLYEPIYSDANTWARFVERTVAHYPDIRYWEIWNEPDMDIYWDGTVQDYFQLLRTGYLATESSNPEAQVIMGGLAYWSEPGFFEDLLDTIIADRRAGQHNHYFDISAWHWYGRSSDLYDKVLWARNVMKQRGISKPIWINETNVLLGQPRPGVPGTEWSASPQEQAAFIVQACANAFSAGVDKVFVFRLDDGPMAERWGLLTNEQMPRPAYAAFQAVAEFIGDAMPTHRGSQDGVAWAAFQNANGQAIWVIWNETPEPRAASLPIDGTIVELGYPDRRTRVKEIKDGALHLMLPPATARSSVNMQDYFIGGMPVFVTVESSSEK